MSRTEGPIAEWVSSLSPAVPSVIMAAAAVPALWVNGDTINWPWLVLMVCMITGGGILMWMHGRRDAETQRAADERNKQTLRDSLEEKDREKEKERQSYETLVDEMTMGVFNLVLGQVRTGLETPPSSARSRVRRTTSPTSRNFLRAKNQGGGTSPLRHTPWPVMTGCSASSPSTLRGSKTSRRSM